ncbi:isoamyl acetate-hydrolyzing esterase 1 homolog [Bradysia coprophila]|uniref:isoamyl acetate-hydrolyzing esterase 1 homolog n=1 Tax=Bradysia coprophila TaxID=38358 RepID=UPI00187DBF30|nr:isoamyl acetate-hydrolyzing esterase 1 homolog [Bradysia coprophila]
MPWSTILLFGDSITEQSFSSQGRWAALLADRFQRMADVIPRGFSGYNTRWCKILLPDILNSINAKDVSCMTIFLGANDCSLPTSDQYVPVDEFQQNLETMISILECRGIVRQKIVFITPPIYFHSHFVAASAKDGDPDPLRSDDRPAIYAKAMVELAEKLNVSVVDAYSAFAADGRGEELFYDGLHFSPAGSELLYNLVVKDIEARVLAFRDESSANETINYARWRDVDGGNLEESLFRQTTAKN